MREIFTSSDKNPFIHLIEFVVMTNGPMLRCSISVESTAQILFTSTIIYEIKKQVNTIKKVCMYAEKGSLVIK